MNVIDAEENWLKFKIKSETNSVDIFLIQFYEISSIFNNFMTIHNLIHYARKCFTNKETDKYQNGYGILVSGCLSGFSLGVSYNVVVKSLPCTACCLTKRGFVLVTDALPVDNLTVSI